MNGVKKSMRCFNCISCIYATITQAKAHGWAVWVGGATCKHCTRENKAPGADPPDDHVELFDGEVRP